MPSFIQGALGCEAVFNIIGAIPFILFPERLLSFAILADESKSAISTVVPASTATLWRLFGGLFLGLTVPVLLCIPNSDGATERRKLTYATLTAGEAFLIPIVLWQAVEPEKSGFTRTALLGTIGALAPTMTWHVICYSLDLSGYGLLLCLLVKVCPWTYVRRHMKLTRHSSSKRQEESVSEHMKEAYA